MSWILKKLRAKWGEWARVTFWEELVCNKPIESKEFYISLCNFGVWVTRCLKSGAAESSVIWNRDVAPQAGGSSRVLSINYQLLKERHVTFVCSLLPTFDSEGHLRLSSLRPASKKWVTAADWQWRGKLREETLRILCVAKKTWSFTESEEGKSSPFPLTLPSPLLLKLLASTCSLCAPGQNWNAVACLSADPLAKGRTRCSAQALPQWICSPAAGAQPSESEVTSNASLVSHVFASLKQREQCWYLDKTQTGKNMVISQWS